VGTIQVALLVGIPINTVPAPISLIIIHISLGFLKPQILLPFFKDFYIKNICQQLIFWFLLIKINFLVVEQKPVFGENREN
jgi:hypothetical protein